MGSSFDDFEALRTLLKLKRHEVPPPRFFEDFPRGVLGRLRGPDGLREESLLSSLGLDFLLKPAMFYGLGVACCALAVYAVAGLLLHRPDPAQIGAQTAALSTSPPGFASPALAEQESSAAALASAPDSASSDLSTNPVLAPVGVGFAIDAFKLRPTPVSFQPK